MNNNVQIIIDLGHGGRDPGAIANGYTEKNLNLLMGLKLVKALKPYFSNLLVTRDNDSTFKMGDRAKRVALEAERFSGETICLSQHFNASANTKVRGCETIHSIYAKPELATCIANSICALSIPLKRVFSRRSIKHGPNRDYYAMHRLTGKAQTVIIEPLFLSNSEDVKLFKQPDFLDKLVKAEVSGLLKYLGIEEIIDYEKKYKELLDEKKLDKIRIESLETCMDELDFSIQCVKETYTHLITRIRAEFKNKGV